MGFTELNISYAANLLAAQDRFCSCYDDVETSRTLETLMRVNTCLVEGRWSCPIVRDSPYKQEDIYISKVQVQGLIDVLEFCAFDGETKPWCDFYRVVHQKSSINANRDRLQLAVFGLVCYH